MKVIYKYVLPSPGSGVITTLQGPILSVQNQGGLSHMWILGDLALPQVSRELVCVGTGWEIEDLGGLEHIGTVQDSGFVWHYFQRIVS